MTDSKIIPLPDLKQIETDAARWIMRLDDGDASQEDQAAFKDWLGQSEQHRSTFLRLNDLWGGLDILEDLKDIAASDDVVGIVEQSRKHPARAIARNLATWSIAASLLMVSLIAFYQLEYAGINKFEADYQTTVGEQQRVVLPDGSEILLNTGTIASVDFSRAARNIYLQQGEAFFDVARDTSRPFTVSTDKGSVKALGTAFSVSLRGDSVGVVVTEGRVALSSGNKETKGREDLDHTLMEVTAGQSVAFAEKVERLSQVEPEFIEQELDWRDGVLGFNGEPLEQVIADISPYTSLSIEIDGEALKQQPIGGYFKVGEIESLFEALSLMANVKVEHVNDEQIRLYRDEQSSGVR